MTDKLKKWADKTAKAYNALAMELNRKGIVAPAFYTQSNLFNIRCSPEVLILGINPGSDGSYEEQRRNVSWGLKEKPMDGDSLLKGNPYWENRESWAYWRRLHQLFGSGDNPLDDESNFVVTNATFFATLKAKEVSDDLFAHTIPYTLELIDILKPQLIVVLSGKKLLKHLQGAAADVAYSSLFGGIGIYTGSINSIPCCGIPHPSASLYREERELMQRIVGQMYRKEPIVREEHNDLVQAIRQRKKTRRLSKDIIKELFDALVKRMDDWLYLCYEPKEKVRRYDLNNGFQLTISNNSSTKGIALRPKEYHGQNDLDRYPIAHVKEILECMEQANYVNAFSWLGLKNFDTLVVDDVNQTADKLMAEIGILINRINEILKSTY